MIHVRATESWERGALDIEWWYTQRHAAFGIHASGFEPSSTAGWDQARVDDVLADRVTSWSLREKEERIRRRLLLVPPMTFAIYEARWRSFGPDAELASLQMRYRADRGSYLGLAVLLAAREGIQRPLEVFKALATTARPRVREARDRARELWIAGCKIYEGETR